MVTLETFYHHILKMVYSKLPIFKIELGNLPE